MTQLKKSDKFQIGKMLDQKMKGMHKERRKGMLVSPKNGMKANYLYLIYFRHRFIV